MDPFLNGRDCSLGTSVSNRVYHQEARKSINYQKTMKIPVTLWVKRSFVINVNSPERDCFVLPLFQWYFVPVFRLWFFVLASQTISSECTDPVKQTRLVIESFCIVIRFCGSQVSAIFVVMSKSETC